MSTDNAKHSEATADMNEQPVSAAESVKPQHAEEERQLDQAKAEHAKATHATARNRRWVRIVLVVVGAILVLCLIVAAALGWFVNSGKDELLADNDTGSVRQTISRDGKSYVFNEDMATVALIGTDRLYGYVMNKESRGHADAIMLVAYDTSTGKVTLINVPRNTITRFSYPASNGGEGSVETFISAAFAYGNTDAESAEVVCGAVSDLLSGLPVENYVVLMESCIGPLTEAMGGVTITAVDDAPSVGIKKGETYTVTGEKALRYVQYRNTNIITSPADRMRRQHDFAQAFLHQTIDAVKKDPSILGKFYDIISDPEYMTTNLHANELAYLASAVITNGASNLELVTLPYTEDYDPVSTLMGYIPDYAGIMDILLDVYYKPVE